MDYRLSRAGRSPLWFRIRFLLSRYPLLYQPYSRWRYPKSSLFRDTDLLIEGFGRSGKDFTADSFRIANDFNIKLAWGQKSAAAAAEAARWGVPTLMLIREPRATVLSNRTMNQNLPIGLLLKTYVAYHSHVWRFREHFVVATNVQVWDEFGTVVAKINRRFGTSFPEPTDTEALRAQVKEFQDRGYREKYGDDWSESVKRTLNYPTEEKKRMREAVESLYDEPRLGALRDGANEWFERYASLAAVDQRDPPAQPS